MISSDLMHTNDLGCQIYSDSETYRKFNTNLHRTSGVVRFSMNAHKLAALKRYQTVILPDGTEASHLCHTKCCVNIQHIRAESHSLNKKRQICHNNFMNEGSDCSGHEGHPDCILY